jgi:hypothetical protein
MKQLAALPLLERLFLAGSPAGDAELAMFRRMAQLEVLDLSATHVTECGLPHLAGLDKLLVLDLGSTAVADAGLPYLGMVSFDFKCWTSM